MSDEARTGAVLFANRPDRMTTFYANVLGLREASRAADHVVLESRGFQLVVHRTGGPALTAPDVPAHPVRRAAVAFKLVFFVDSIARIRSAVAEHGGEMEGPEREWSFEGALVCDALDPEGNVIQFRAPG